MLVTVSTALICVALVARRGAASYTPFNPFNATIASFYRGKITKNQNEYVWKTSKRASGPSKRNV